MLHNKQTWLGYVRPFKTNTEIERFFKNRNPKRRSDEKNNSIIECIILIKYLKN
jgi:hypothetical protein